MTVPRDPHDGDAAFQATLLVIVRRAGSIGRRNRRAGYAEFRYGWHGACTNLLTAEGKPARLAWGSAAAPWTGKAIRPLLPKRPGAVASPSREARTKLRSLTMSHQHQHLGKPCAYPSPPKG